MRFFGRKRTPDPAPLTGRTEQHLSALFSPSDREEARSLLINECGRNLPMLEQCTPGELERFRFAALKISEGRLDDLKGAIALAKSDWRDLLVSAGFAKDIDAHESWRPGEPTELPW